MVADRISLSDLDDDVLIHVFSFLSIADILAMRQVSSHPDLPSLPSAHQLPRTHRPLNGFSLCPTCKACGGQHVSVTSSTKASRSPRSSSTQQTRLTSNDGRATPSVLASSGSRLLRHRTKCCPFTLPLECLCRRSASCPRIRTGSSRSPRAFGPW